MRTGIIYNHSAYIKIIFLFLSRLLPLVTPFHRGRGSGGRSPPISSGCTPIGARHIFFSKSHPALSASLYPSTLENKVRSDAD
jgi:hypothetical protein